MSLFQRGEFRLHSGSLARWKIDCDALSREDWWTLTAMLRDVLPRFGRVEGVPRGGLPLAWCLEPFASGSACDPLLIVDDVWTTGASMEAVRQDRDAIGGVVFARGPYPDWVTALFSYTGGGVGGGERVSNGQTATGGGV